MQPDTSTFTNPATRHQPTPNSAPRTEWPSEPTAVFAPQLHSLYLFQCPIDMRLGIDGVLARVIHWFGSARPHCAYAVTNARGNRIKLLLHDGLGLWLVLRRLHSGRFAWINEPL
ncbi:MAG: IS66 family insertion sequence element accessory protein TnpB, partial [Hydrogenophaga sp.]|nr:IS66 family insertion sequence element accessory protein TnpB [Hydrogenophaga sp.]